MSNIAHYIWMALLLLYIISPYDLFPAFFDDLVAFGVLLYLYLRGTKQRPRGGYSYSGSYTRDGRSDAGGRSHHAAPGTETTLEEAYRTLGVSPDAPWEEVKKAYKEKIARCHPDKVSHLSEELQEKARELTLRLNNVFEVIKKSRMN